MALEQFVSKMNPHVNRWASEIDIMFIIYFGKNGDHLRTWKEINHGSIEVRVYKQILRRRNLKVHYIINSFYWRDISLWTSLRSTPLSLEISRWNYKIYEKIKTTSLTMFTKVDVF